MVRRRAGVQGVTSVKHNNRLSRSDYLAQFDAAVPSYHADEAEVLIHEDGAEIIEWAVAMPAKAGRIDSATITMARAALSCALDLDAEAHAFLETHVAKQDDAARRAIARLERERGESITGLKPPVEHDPALFALIVHADHVRLCYESTAVNDEWAVRFNRTVDGWACAGFTSRKL